MAIVRRSLVAFALATSVAGHAHAVTPLADAYGGCGNPGTTKTIPLGPGGNYQATIDVAQPGQRIVLASGSYTNGLRLYDRNGAPGSCLVIEGPSDRSAVFVGLPLNGIRNVVQIRNSSFVVLRNITIDGDGTTDIDAVKSDATIQGGHPFAWSHHVTLENLLIRDFDFDQQQVGISTKGPAWNWVVRRNVLERIGTGMYFGDSTGAQPFVNGLIEYNLVRDTVGYAIQIKHQTAATRPSGIGFETLPATGRTVIRHNVLAKGANSSTGGDARPNLLVGAQPSTGAGSDDDIVVAANFLYQNPSGSEGLFQGEGNVILYANVLYNSFGSGIAIQPQNGEVRRIRVFHNTVLAAGSGVFVSSSVNPTYTQLVRANATFAATPYAGGAQADNVGAAFASAASFVVNPSGVVAGTSNRMDLYPLDDALSGSATDATPIAAYPDAARDFDDRVRDPALRGAYGTDDAAATWQLALEIRPEGPPDTLFANGFE